jgi:exosortase D (VPLPA-CTERM-specific)
MSVQSLAKSDPSRIRAGILVLLAIVVAIFVFGNALLELVHRWSTEEEYSHGFLIPVVSAWLLWNRRDALAANLGRPSWWGPVLILLAILTHMIGEYSSIFILSQFAFIFVLFGLTLAVGGYPLLKVAFIPIAFLIFAIPVPYFIESSLTLQLQLISSRLGVDIIRMFQIPVYLSGNVIDLGYYQLQVVEACSGLRYLYPLLSLSFLAAYVFQAPMWQRVLVFLSGVPITIGMNGLRIGLVGVTVDRWGSEMANGVLHFFEGWIIFVACAALLLGEIYLLARLSGTTFFQAFRLPAPTIGKQNGETRSVRFPQMALVSGLVLTFGAAIAVQLISHRPEFIPERTRFAAFPSSIGGWQGHPVELDRATVKALGLDDYILSNYQRTDGKSVNLYVAYYSTQRNGYAPHSPTVCIPGDGWLITHLETITYKGANAPFPFNRLIIERGGTKQLVYYWFDERGRTIANEYWAKWYLLVDAITKNRTDGSLIRLITQIFPGETEADADRRLRSFMRIAVPTIDAYLPDERGTKQPKSTLGSGGAADHG